jgi:hypothetical protein
MFIATFVYFEHFKLCVNYFFAKLHTHTIIMNLVGAGHEK